MSLQLRQQFWIDTLILNSTVHVRECATWMYEATSLFLHGDTLALDNYSKWITHCLRPYFELAFKQIALILRVGHLSVIWTGSLYITVAPLNHDQTLWSSLSLCQLNLRITVYHATLEPSIMQPLARYKDAICPRERPKSDENTIDW